MDSINAAPTINTKIRAKINGGLESTPLSAADPVTTFANHWWRPRDGVLKQRETYWAAVAVELDRALTQFARRGLERDGIAAPVAADVTAVGASDAHAAH